MGVWFPSCLAPLDTGQQAQKQSIIYQNILPAEYTVGSEKSKSGDCKGANLTPPKSYEYPNHRGMGRRSLLTLLSPCCTRASQTSPRCRPAPHLSSALPLGMREGLMQPPKVSWWLCGVWQIADYIQASRVRIRWILTPLPACGSSLGYKSEHWSLPDGQVPQRYSTLINMSQDKFRF